MRELISHWNDLKDYQKEDVKISFITGSLLVFVSICIIVTYPNSNWNVLDKTVGLLVYLTGLILGIPAFTRVTALYHHLLQEKINE